MPCNAAALSQHHARQSTTCNFVPSKQLGPLKTSSPPSIGQCNHCSGGASCAPRMKLSASASNQCSIRSSASSSISILSSRSLNNDRHPLAAAGNAKCYQSPSSSSCCHACSCSYSIKSSKSSHGANASGNSAPRAASAQTKDTGDGDSIKIVIVSAGGSSPSSSSSSSSSSNQSCANHGKHCLYQRQSQAPTTATGKARSNSVLFNEVPHECRQHQHERALSSRTNTVVCRSRCLTTTPTSTSDMVGNRQLPCNGQSAQCAQASSSGKCAGATAGLSTPRACACGGGGSNSGTSNSGRQHDHATSKQQHSSMREREGSKATSCRSSCSSVSAAWSSSSSSSSASPPPKSQVSSCSCESVSKGQRQPANWPPQTRNLHPTDQVLACQQCAREKREANLPPTCAAVDAKCCGESQVETDDESAASSSRGGAGRSGETRARQKLSALFESGPQHPLPAAQKAALICESNSAASRCPAASDFAPSVVSCSSSSSRSSRASFSSSSHAALSAYTTSSISMILATAAPNKQQQDAGQKVSDNNNNNNESDFPDAYASLDTKAAPPLPPPPPPPPPPLPPLMPPTSLLGTASAVDGDPLRQAVAKRLHLNSTTGDHLLMGMGGAGDTGQSTKSTLGSVAQRRPPSVSAMAAFIPPQFAAPPKDGANIKPSEYLKRVNSNSTLSTLASSSGGSATSSSSSGVSSKNQSAASTPIGSLSSSTGASLISRTSLARCSNGGASEEDTGGLGPQSKLGVAARASVFEPARTQQVLAHTTANRFRQLRQGRQQSLRAFELNRSQSTSALNKLEADDREEDETGSVISGPDGDEDEDHSEGDSSCSAAGTSGPDQSSLPGASSEGVAPNHPDGPDDVTSNLMNELRSFDKSKLARMMAKRLEADGSGGSGRHATVAQTSDKLDHLLAATKRDLIAELKESKDLDGIKRMRESSKGGGGSRDIKQVLEQVAPVSFKPEDFLDKIAESEPALPLWRRQMLAKKAAERARKEHEERVKLALEEKRLSQVPQWKRQMMAKKAAERSKRSAEVERTKKDSEQRHLSEMPTWRRQLARIKITASTGSINTIGYRETDATTTTTGNNT